MTEKFIKKSEKYGRIFEEKITEKRRKINPFITKVENDAHIILNEKIIFETAGSWSDFFGNDNDIVLEIGTGFGNFFSQEVAENINTNFIGVELKYKRLFITAEKCRKKRKTSSLSSISDLDEGKLGTNFILLKTKGENIDKFLGDAEVSKTYVFFPDPWGKKERQKKHRLFSEKFIKDLHQKTKTGGELIFKTDHREYFDTTLALFETVGGWKITVKSYDYENDNVEYDRSRKTEFETIFNEKNICYVELKKVEKNNFEKL